MTDQPEHQHSGKPEPDQVRPKKDVVRYCPVSKLPRLGEQIASELDKREFPGEIELALAEQIDVLERRLCTTLIVYRSEVHEGVLQLCQMIDSDQLGNEALREVRALEESFGLDRRLQGSGQPGSDSQSTSDVSQLGS